MAPPDFRFVVCLSESWLFVYELSLVQLSVLSVWLEEELESRCFQLECQMQTELFVVCSDLYSSKIVYVAVHLVYRSSCVPCSPTNLTHDLVLFQVYMTGAPDMD